MTDIQCAISRSREILSAATPGPWNALKMRHKLEPQYRISGVHSAECKIYHAKLDPDCIPETHARQIGDSIAIAHTRNVHDLLLDIARAAYNSRHLLLDRLLHGDDAHRAWLKAEVDFVFSDLDRALQAFADEMNRGV